MRTRQDIADARRAALGQRLRTLRLRNNLTQEKLAQMAGIHRTFLAEVENARHSIVLERVLAIADALDVPIHQLLPTDREALDAVAASGGADHRMVIAELDEAEYWQVVEAAQAAGISAAEYARRALLRSAEDHSAEGQGRP